MAAGSSIETSVDAEQAPLGPPGTPLIRAAMLRRHLSALPVLTDQGPAAGPLPDGSAPESSNQIVLMGPRRRQKPSSPVGSR